jgi:hypothetical protein
MTITRSMKARRLEKWRLASREFYHVKVTTLWLYPELDCSACVEDCYEKSGDEQLRYYVNYIKTAYDGRYRHWWDNDAVPIYWTVMGDDDGFGCEQAPFELDGYGGDNVLTIYNPPINVRTGEQINWYKDLPVINSRFPEFAAALGWLPSPGQLTAPLRSIITGPVAARCSARGRLLTV